MRLRFIVLALLVSLAPAYAETKDLQEGFDWLTSQAEDGNFKDIQATAMAALAFKEANGLARGQLSIDKLLSISDTCWPSGSCKTKDTALALLALEAYAKDTDPVLDWFDQAQTPASAVGDWYLEVITTGSGTCKISYGTKSKDVQVVAGNFPSCQNSTFFNLNSCLEPNLLTSNPSIEFDVNCATLGSGTKIAMVYQTGTSYYLISEAATTQALLPVSNACFGDSQGASCSVEPSLYANWALEKARSSLTVLPWLEDNYIKVNELQTALIILSSGNQEHLESLVNMQAVDGNFNGDITVTAMAALAFKEAARTTEFDSAKAWLIQRQRNDGSWGDTFTTALVLYAIYDGESILFKAPSLGGEVSLCNNDGFCDSNFGENYVNCPLDCECGDGVCDSKESSATCSQDCGVPASQELGPYCGDGVCDLNENNDFCPADCTKEGGLPWLWLILILILLTGAVFFYLKYIKKKDQTFKPVKIIKPEEFKKSSYKPVIKPTLRPITQARKTRTESELERSLKEARKLLKK